MAFKGFLDRLRGRSPQGEAPPPAATEAELPAPPPPAPEPVEAPMAPPAPERAPEPIPEPTPEPRQTDGHDDREEDAGREGIADALAFQQQAQVGRDERLDALLLHQIQYHIEVFVNILILCKFFLFLKS
jgi:hypothetical protein